MSRAHRPSSRLAAIVVVAAMLLLPACAGCPAELRGCSCHKTIENSSLVVNCTATEFHKAKMFQYVPEETVQGIFTGNVFGELPAPLFGEEADMFDLKWLDLSNNSIQHIHGQTLNRMPNLEVLILGNNDIYLGSRTETHKVSGLHTRLFSNLHHLKDLNLANAFTEELEADRYITHLHEIFFYSNFSKLEFLDLTGNELSVVNPRNHQGAPDHDLFCETPNVNIVYLIDNDLRALHVRPECLSSLSQLRLDGNKFAYLDNEDIASVAAMPKLEVLNLSRNPFVCDCRARDFVRWVQTDPHARRVLADRSALRCYIATPARYGGVPIIDVDADALTCPLKATAGSGRRRASWTALAVMVTALAVLAILVAYSARRHLAAKLLHVVRRSTYRPLDQEVATLRMTENPTEVTEFDV